MTTSRIHLVRHGEVDNPDGILYGRLPGFGLTARGRQMGERISDYFADDRFNVRGLVRSPLLRTAQTIAPLAQSTGLEPVVDERVIEAGNRFEGQKVNRSSVFAPANLPLVWNPLRPSWGEPYISQVRRMQAAIFTLRNRVEAVAKAEGLDVVDGVIVSHQLPIWMSRMAVEGRPLAHDPRNRECNLGSVTTLSFDGAKLVGVDYTDVNADLQPKKAVAGA